MSVKQAYTPGLEISARTKFTKVRELPLPGRALVKVGDTVQAGTAVLTAELPGDLDILRLADQLGFEPSEVIAGMHKKVGDEVAAGEVVCEIKSFFGWFTSTARSPSNGVIEFFTEANGHLGIRRPSSPFVVRGYLNGKVTDIVEGRSVTIEAEAALIQGIFGVGGERYGVVEALKVSPSEIVSAQHIRARKEELNGKVLIGGSAFELEALYAARDAGVQAIVTGSVTAETLRGFVGHEIGVSITGDEAIDLSLIITEGFGCLPMSSRVVSLAKELHGKQASVSGATQVRAGAMRPEVVVSLGGLTSSGQAANDNSRVLDQGRQVRVIRVPYFGQFGKVVALPHEPEKLESGAVVRVVHVQLENGQTVSVPRANIELVG